jgi:hypothetical protein
MSCPRENEAILSLTEFGLTEIERKAFEAHVSGCAECQSALARHRQAISRYQRDNDEVCRAVQAHLVEYLLGEIKQTAGIRIKPHLQECPRCSLLCQDLERALAKEEWAEMRQPLPRGLRAKSAEEKARNKFTRIKDELLTEGQVIIDVIIRETALQPAFMGEEGWGARDITHRGGDLVIHLGAPGKTVHLLTSGGQEMEAQASNSDGFVRFRDYLAGDYRIRVEGVEILAVKYEKKI